MKYRIILLALVIFSCKKEKFSTIEIYGHAGNGMEIQNAIYHDNSKEAIELALGTEGVFGVEIDVRLSADGQLWLFHDDELSTETNSEGCVENKTSDELNQVKYSTIHHEKLVKLADLNFEAYGSNTFLIDARHYKGCDYSAIDYTQFVNALTVLKNNHPSIHFIILTRITDWIADFHSQGFAVYFEINVMDEYSTLDQTNLQFEGIIVKNSLISKEDVTKIKNDFRKVLIFDLRSPKGIKKAMKKGPTGIVSDDVSAAVIEKE